TNSLRCSMIDTCCQGMAASLDEHHANVSTIYPNTCQLCLRSVHLIGDPLVSIALLPKLRAAPQAAKLIQGPVVQTGALDPRTRRR
ncbi:hypothetical protein, partial [Roseibium sp.]|uniref:hypothetical protein n=1 Tax=Roseibium sp. TaxID=1936156 RepID=UPI003A974CDF